MPPGSAEVYGVVDEEAVVTIGVVAYVVARDQDVVAGYASGETDLIMRVVFATRLLSGPSRKRCGSKYVLSSGTTVAVNTSPAASDTL